MYMARGRRGGGEFESRGWKDGLGDVCAEEGLQTGMVEV